MIIILQVYDDGATPRTESATATITITDENDNPPVFTNTPYSFNVDENVANDTIVDTVTATDADIGSNAVIMFELVTTEIGTQDHFYVETNTGIIRANTDDLDREAVAAYRLVIRAYDQGTPMLYADVDVDITINDLNDESPLLDQNDYSTNIQENSAVSVDIFL